MKLLIDKDKAISILQDRIREVSSYNFDPQVWKDRTRLDVQYIFGRMCEQWLQVGQLRFDTYITSEKAKTLAEGKANMAARRQSLNICNSIELLCYFCTDGHRQYPNCSTTP